MNNKYFLGVGIDIYPKRAEMLFGCKKDIDDWWSLLKNKSFGFKKTRDHIFNSKAKKELILKEFDHLLEMIGEDESSLGVFVFSGHGDIGETQNDPSDVDGINELIKVYDGYISDDCFRKIINEKIQQGKLKGKLICVFDSCYSGTVTDSPYLASAFSFFKNIFNRKRKCNLVKTTFVSEKKNDLRKLNKLLIPTNNTKDILLSACLSDELAYEIKNVDGTSNGAFSRCAIDIIKEMNNNGATMTYEALITQVNQDLSNGDCGQKAQVYGKNTNTQSIFT